ncbi:MAG TPA: DUF4286 family protein [Cyclobacteriaceae bacterium]|nr:DUF4286 family protein [Cyclobacteriaceae bacterium]HRJ82696.1 DUF4286 family protein [Cyclobacteriaceae bacterium]
MYLYNVTIGIDKEVELEWLAWMKNEHIPDVLATNMFITHKVYKVLHDNEDGTASYSIQYFADSLDKVVHYLEHLAPALIEKHKQKYGNRHVAFRTLLEEV